MFAFPLQLDHRKFKQFFTLLPPHWPYCALHTVGALCMVLNKTEDLVSLTPVWGIKETSVLGWLKCSQEFVHFHQGTESYNHIWSELEETF